MTDVTKYMGYEKYSGNFFAASGCGPTTLSMVVVYLTHNRVFFTTMTHLYAIIILS